MGLFDKFFGKKKNEIHLSAQEAFAPDDQLARPESAATEAAPEREAPAAQEPVETVPDAPQAEELNAVLPAQEQDALSVVLYFYAEKLDNAALFVRSALRDCH